MAYVTPITKNVGDTFTAAEFNTYIRDNMAAGVPDIFQAAGDLAVASGADAASRLAKGGKGQILRMDDAGSALLWGAILTARQGGNASTWNTVGTTTYTPSNTIIQIGSNTVTLASGDGTLTVTYPVAFGNTPIVFVWPTGAGVSQPQYAQLTVQSASGFTASVKQSTVSGGMVVYWLAIGPSA